MALWLVVLRLTVHFVLGAGEFLVSSALVLGCSALEVMGLGLEAVGGAFVVVLGVEGGTGFQVGGFHALVACDGFVAGGTGELAGGAHVVVASGVLSVVHEVTRSMLVAPGVLRLVAGIGTVVADLRAQRFDVALRLVVGGLVMARFVVGWLVVAKFVVGGLVMLRLAVEVVLGAGEVLVGCPLVGSGRGLEVVGPVFECRCAMGVAMVGIPCGHLIQVGRFGAFPSG